MSRSTSSAKAGRFQWPVSVQPRTETLIGADFAITGDELLNSGSRKDFPYREPPLPIRLTSQARLNAHRFPGDRQLRRSCDRT